MVDISYIAKIYFAFIIEANLNKLVQNRDTVHS